MFDKRKEPSSKEKREKRTMNAKKGPGPNRPSEVEEE